MVAEKPSIAASIAKALCNDCSYETRNGKTPIFELTSSFKSVPCLYKITSVTGHMYSCDFPAAYSNWDTVDPESLFQAPTVKKLESKGLYQQLQKEARGADTLILWLDCDREGENICFEVIETVRDRMQNAASLKFKEPLILRAKFSAVTKKDIQHAMETLVAPNIHVRESWAVDARQELDLKVGVAFSRFQTRYFQGRYGDLDSNLVSYGPCQTPTLGFCVDRFDQIQQFQPEPFWTIEVDITKDNQTIKLDWDRGHIFDHEAVCALNEVISEKNTLLVSSVKESEVTRSRPTPLNTVQLLQHASKQLSMGPFTTMQIAERLYLQGYISYPRTESTSYPDSFDVQSTLSQHTRNSHWGAYVANLLHRGYQRPKKGVDVGDHPPITPVRAVELNELSGEMARLYDFIARYFIATVSRDARLLATSVSFTCQTERFSITGHRVLDRGFTEILTSTSLMDTFVPDFKVGELNAITRQNVRQGQTSPPGFLTESELIGLMEKHGIGTDASIPAHINNICERNYVRLASGRTLVPTNLGVVLVHGYYKVDPELVLPRVRAAIEEQCTLIAKGIASKNEVIEHSLEIFRAKFAYFVRKINMMDTLFEATFSPLAATGKPLSKCGKCSRYMKYVHLKPQRLHCPTCNETYSLPQNGSIKLYKEYRCPFDQFELVLFSLGNSGKAMGKSYSLCPYCYNHPPFEDVVDKMGCNACLHPTCKHSLIQNGVCPCPGSNPDEMHRAAPWKSRTKFDGKADMKDKEEVKMKSDDVKQANIPCNGSLVLDVNSKPNWKLACNICNLLIRFRSDVAIHTIHTVKASMGGKPEYGKHDSPICAQKCSMCGSNNLVVEFHKDKVEMIKKEASASNDQNWSTNTSYVGCLLCDHLLSRMTERKLGRVKHISLVNAQRSSRRGGGRGRGRGSRKKGGLLSVEEF
ncbi:unnamed protein product [Albugo candida]|nr:unnamed protein product [Albugo candida]|eukprot:CCI49690.1 unnamed protein product [Albugo candida]